MSNYFSTQFNNHSENQSEGSIHDSESKKNRSIIPNRSTSFAMSGCGWLWPFYLGVIKTMKKKGYLTDSSICAGTSGGALGALVATSGIEPELALDIIIQLSKASNFKKDIDKGLKQHLIGVLPKDTLEKCNNRLFVTATRFWPNPTTSPTMISQFDSHEQLIDAVAASCFIPLYSAPRIYTSIVGLKNNKYIDGGILAFLPPIGDVRVSPFPREYIFRSIGAPPHICLKRHDYTLPLLLFHSLSPGSATMLTELFKKGSEAADEWIRVQEAVSQPLQ